MKYIANPVVVEAFRIEAVESVACLENRYLLHVDNGGRVVVTAGFAEVRIPEVGDYWIQLSETDKYVCPREVFERKYVKHPRQVSLNFGDALTLLKSGWRVCRAGWNGKGMWLAYSPGSQALPAERFWAGPNREYAQAHGGKADVLPCITMKTATGEILMGWLASQSDMLAEDWMIVP